MRSFVTGATGFIGGRVAAALRARGDEVVSLVRKLGGAAHLRELGCELVEGDLGSADEMRSAMLGCDGVFHIAAIYKVGIPPSQHDAMFRANVEGTANALDAAAAAGVGRILYTSTVNVFGNTGGQAADESYHRDLSAGFLSFYDETKYRAHELAEKRIAAGVPIVIVQPSGVYGPGDHSELGLLFEQVSKGRMLMIPFPEMGIGLAHVDDIAAGMLLAFDKGRIGESYVLTGELVRMRELVQMIARITGRREPQLGLPTWVVRGVAPLAALLGPPLGLPPNLHEAISASDGVTYWATDAKARSELGYSPRSLHTGLRETLGR
jgi:dihydroflavonol-4-reductase